MSTSRQRRKNRQRANVDSCDSGHEQLQQKIRTLHGSNAIIWARWQQQVKIMGIFVVLYALYHSVTDLLHHYQNNLHLPLLENIMDCLWQILVHVITAINAVMIRQYISGYPSQRAKQWLMYIWPISLAECFFITHSFPMGTFYLLICLAMVYFVDAQQKMFKTTKNDLQKLANKQS